MQRLAHHLEGSFDRNSFKVTSKPADQAAIPDLTASDLFVLGSLPDEGDPIHSDFSEILRALGGITLAGRVAGAFSVSSEPTVNAFRQALEDCELVLSDRNFLNFDSAQPASSELKGWAEALTGQLEKCARER
jgi:flavodoxin